MAKKIKIDIEKFIDAVGLLYRLDRIPTKDLDFTCIFQKDLTIKQKKDLGQYTANSDLMKTMIAVHQHYEKDLKNKLRKDLKVIYNRKKGTWRAKLINQKSKKK